VLDLVGGRIAATDVAVEHMIVSHVRCSWFGCRLRLEL
jgi:hypothetical protein